MFEGPDDVFKVVMDASKGWVELVKADPEHANSPH
jgi:hypothetical protein